MGFKKRPQTEAEFVNASSGIIIKPKDSTKDQIFYLNLRVPESLWDRLNYYVENHASRRESKNQIILDALDIHLKTKNT